MRHVPPSNLETCGKSSMESDHPKKTRPRGSRPEAGIWEVSQLTGKGLNSNEQENAKTELYFKRVISHHVVLFRKLLEIGRWQGLFS